MTAPAQSIDRKRLLSLARWGWDAGKRLSAQGRAQVMHGTLHSEQPANSSTASGSRYRPPAPIPQPKPLGVLRLISTLKRNPLECWTREHFEKPIVVGGLPFKHVLLVHEPAAIRRVLLDNAGNYQKDSIQRRVLSAGLGDGLLSAEN